ncbi:MAG: hypothetical protein J6T26_07045, partial [Firmicutes bacterium]|nr:hypothetical protein [Bacillota bacterium]
GNEDSIKALTAKGDLLQRQLLQQKDKVQTLRDALANAAQQYGEADKRTQDWQIKLNDAEAAQIGLEQAIEQNNEEIKKQTDGFQKESGAVGKLGDQVNDLAGKFGIRLPKEATAALNSMQGFSTGTVAALGAVAAAVTAIIESVKKLNEMTLDAAGRADDLATQSMVAGVDTRTLQQWQYAAPYIDVSADTIVGALGKITKAAAAGDEAFQKLGVSIYDQSGYLRDSEDLLFESLEALSMYGNETERNAVAQELLGKSYAELNPLILQMDEARRLANEALEQGYVLTEGQIEILTAVDDAHEKYNQTVQKNKDLIAVQWGPAVKTGYELLQKMIDKAGKMLIDSKLVENFAALVQSTMSLIDTISELFDLLPSGLNPINQLSSALRGLAVVMATIADAANVVAGLMPWNWGSGKATTALGWNINQGQMSNLQQLKYGNSGWTWNEELGAWNAAGDANWRGGLTWVGEAGPELVSLPRGSQIYSNQESRGMGGGTDTSRIEALLARNVELLEEIGGEFSGLRVRRRMA